MAIPRPSDTNRRLSKPVAISQERLSCLLGYVSTQYIIRKESCITLINQV